MLLASSLSSTRPEARTRKHSGLTKPRGRALIWVLHPSQETDRVSQRHPGPLVEASAQQPGLAGRARHRAPSLPPPSPAPWSHQLGAGRGDWLLTVAGADGAQVHPGTKALCSFCERRGCWQVSCHSAHVPNCDLCFLVEARGGGHAWPDGGKAVKMGLRAHSV